MAVLRGLKDAWAEVQARRSKDGRQSKAPCKRWPGLAAADVLDQDALQTGGIGRELNDSVQVALKRDIAQRPARATRSTDSGQIEEAQHAAGDLKLEEREDSG